MNQELKYQFKININNLNNAHTRCINMIENSSTVLDLGCASGVIGEYLQKEKECKLIGVDIEKDQLKEAEIKNCYKKLYNLDLNLLETQFDCYKESFDYILMADVIEHLYNPLQLLKKLKPLIKEDGCFVFSIPNISHGSIKLKLLKNNFDYTSMGLLDETHIRFFTLKTILKMMQDLNLEIVSIDRVYNPVDRACQRVNTAEYPKEVVDFVKNDFESFVYQYIIKAKKSLLEPEDISIINLEKIQISQEDIKLQKNFIE